MKLEYYVEKLPRLFWRVKQLEVATGGIEEGSKKLIQYTVDNYTALLAVPTPSVNEFAFVKNSQGTSWLPGTLGGTYYGKGLYIYSGADWVEANIEINTALADLYREHQVEFITSDIVLEDSTTFDGQIVIKNVTEGPLNVNTVALDKLEGLDTQIIYGGESFTIRKYQINDYRIV
jgi:hypothetical protein